MANAPRERQHGARRSTNDFFRHAAIQDVRHRALPVTAHYNQIDVAILRVAHDFRRGRAGSQFKYVKFCTEHRPELGRVLNCRLGRRSEIVWHENMFKGNHRSLQPRMTQSAYRLQTLRAR
jgi:hypothetical protein